MLEDCRIVGFELLRGVEQLRQSLFVFTLAVMEPAHAVEIGAVVRVARERAFDVILRLIEVAVLIGPHIAEIVVSLGRVRRIGRDRLLEKVRGLVIEAGAFRGRAIFEIETPVGNLLALRLAFMQRFLESGDRFLGVVRFAQGHREEIG